MGEFRMGSLVLRPIFVEIKRLISVLNSISFYHDYRLVKSESDPLSKAGFQIDVRSWSVSEGWADYFRIHPFSVLTR